MHKHATGGYKKYPGYLSDIIISGTKPKLKKKFEGLWIVDMTQCG